jgi:hypothetical protein
MKHKNTFLKLLLIMWLVMPNLMAQGQFPWPVTPFNQNHDITGNFAEYRSTTNPAHFHNGTDIPKADFSPVYPVKDGRVVSLDPNGSNAFVRVDDIAYVHIQPNPNLSIGDSVFVSQTVVGTILSGLGHVHLTNGFVGSEKNSMLMNSGLTPLIDTYPPIIRFIRLYQNNTTNEFPTNEISGRVDIVVKVDEQNGPPGSPTSRLNNGTYKIGYKILSADTSIVVYEPPNGGVRFQFNTKPSNSYVDIVFFKTLSSTTSHTYQVTNNVSSDNYWDTTTMPDSNYVVMAFTEDTRQNTDTAYAAVKIVPTDTEAPAQPVFKYVLETTTGMAFGWFPNTEPDLAGYRLQFSFDNQTWTLFRDENVLTKEVTDTTVNQILKTDVYFKLTAVDNAPVPNVSIESDIYGMSNDDGSVFLGKVLLVDGFDRTSGGWNQPNHYFGHTYGSAIVENNFSFDTVPNESIEDNLIDLNNYEAVFWILGDESVDDETFSAEEQALVIDYLENGGKLFVSGSNIAWDLDPNGAGTATSADEQFLNEYLKIKYVTSPASTISVTGIDSSVFSGLSFNFGQIPYQVDSADVISPFGGGVIPAFKYSSSEFAAIQYEGIFGTGTTSGKLVYCAFPFETIPGEQDRIDLMNRVLDFFFGVTSIRNGSEIPNLLPDNFALLQSYPNPFNPTTALEYHLPEASEVVLEIYNSLGQKVNTLVNRRLVAGRYKATWDGRNENRDYVASGLYIARFSAKSENSSATFQKTRKLLFLK